MVRFLANRVYVRLDEALVLVACRSTVLVHVWQKCASVNVRWCVASLFVWFIAFNIFTDSEMWHNRIQRPVGTAHLVCLWLCTTSVHNTAQNSSDNFPSYFQTTIIAQMLSIGGRGSQRVHNTRIVVVRFTVSELTSSSAIAERPRCRVG